MGLLMRVVVQPANLQDKVGIRALLRRIPFTPRWQRVVVDGGYDSPAIQVWCQKLFGVVYEVVHRLGTAFVVLPRRWVVERTFAWLGKYRRLSKDYEQLPSVSEAFVYVASIHLLVRRLAHA